MLKHNVRKNAAKLFQTSYFIFTCFDENLLNVLQFWNLLFLLCSRLFTCVIYCCDINNVCIVCSLWKQLDLQVTRWGSRCWAERCARFTIHARCCCHFEMGGGADYGSYLKLVGVVMFYFLILFNFENIWDQLNPPALNLFAF